MINPVVVLGSYYHVVLSIWVIFTYLSLSFFFFNLKNIKLF